MRRIYVLTFILSILCCSCSSYQANKAFVELKSNISQAQKELKIGGSTTIKIENNVNADLYVISSAYIQKEYVFSNGQSFGLNNNISKKISQLSGSQDGIYFFIIKNNKIISFSELGSFVRIEEPCIFIKSRDSVELFLKKTDAKYRPLTIFLED
ncbi:MAG: hypothetical protein KJ915_04820 [Candidatus Omnitrophica bacterium]|nr:hypothetical protein [Candidatus Omnitrophota bacterium]